MKKIFLPILVFTAAVLNLQASDLDGIRRAFVEASAQNYAPSEELTQRFIDYSSYGRANDVVLLQLYNSVFLPKEEVDRLLSEFDYEKGCWKDLDYSAQDRGSWPATLHVTRMLSLAKLYISPDSGHEGSKALKELLHGAMRWWFVNMPTCPNWWHNEIGVPKKMATVLLMLRDELSPEEVEGGLRVLAKSKFGMTGQNKIWLAGNNLMKGLLIDDPDLVRKSRDFIAEEIYITDQEGLQEDWSFHQHGPQIQFGNYGLAFADVMSFWVRVLKGSDYAFTPEQTSMLGNLLKEGICFALWKGVMDPSFCGRQNFINAGPGKAFAVAVAAMNISCALEGEEAGWFERAAEQNLSPELYPNAVVGGRYYHRSDCGIWRRPQWYSSIRMHSERTVGFEFTNKENTLANFSADGALILMQDGNEFDNIFAYWDWRKVPGVTAYDDGKALKSDDSVEGKKNHSSHVGGLVSNDAMVSTMELRRDGLHALKSAFFFKDCVVSLGADITADSDAFVSVTTAVDQVHLDGEVSTGANWAHHRGRGYVSLDGTTLSLSTDLQKGKWDAIDPVFHDKWDEGKVFKLWFNHPLEGLRDGKSGSYAYALLPCVTASQTKAAAGKIAKGRSNAIVRVLRNDRDCQAVLCGSTLGAVIHTPGTYRLGGSVFTFDTPTLLLSDGKEVRKEQLPSE